MRDYETVPLGSSFIRHSQSAQGRKAKRADENRCYAQDCCIKAS